MAERTDQYRFVKLSDMDFCLEEPEQDLRGLRVYDQDGNEMGSVEDLYIDREERKARFLYVSIGGFLRLEKRHVLLPVEAVSEVHEDRVKLDQSRQKIAESPFDANVVPQSLY